MASPSAKYSKSANKIMSASASATHAVEPHNTIPTTKGISTAAVSTRFQVMNRNPSTPQGRLTVDTEKLKGKERQKAAFGGRRTSLPAAGGPPLFQSNAGSSVDNLRRR